MKANWTPEGNRYAAIIDAAQRERTKRQSGMAPKASPFTEEQLKDMRLFDEGLERVDERRQRVSEARRRNAEKRAARAE